jgi:hypothetical protein
MPAGPDGTLLVQLDQTGLPAEWEAGAVDTVLPPATVSWWYAGPGGAQTTLPVVQDGTLGLRRSGVVRFTIQTDWTPGPADASGNLPFPLWLRAESDNFAAPPRLTGLWPNVAPARHLQDVVSRVELDWLKLPGNAIALDADQSPPLRGGTSVRLRERAGWETWLPVADFAFSGPDDRVFTVDRERAVLQFGNGETGRIPVLADIFTADDLGDPAALLAAWQQPIALSAALLALVPDAIRTQIQRATVATGPAIVAMVGALNRLLAAPLQDHAALIPVRAAIRLLMQEMQPGAVRPRLNRLLLEDAYPGALHRGLAELHLRIGGGRAGNVGTWRQWERAGDARAPDAVNIVAGQGGTDPESLASAQQRSAGEIRRVTRAVITTDFETLATQTKGVAIARAHAAVSFHPDFPCLPVPGVVTLFVVPAVPRDGCGIVPGPVPDAGALASVVASLEAGRLVGTEIVVRPPTYQPVQLIVDVRATSPAPNRLRELVTARLARFLDPLTGGEGGGGWAFGAALRPSELLRQAQDAIGAAGDVSGLAISLPAVKPPVVAESCADVEIGAHALPALTHVAVRIAAPPRAPGGLT